MLASIKISLLLKFCIKEGGENCRDAMTVRQDMNIQGPYHNLYIVTNAHEQHLKNFCWLANFANINGMLILMVLQYLKYTYLSEIQCLQTLVLRGIFFFD